MFEASTYQGIGIMIAGGFLLPTIVCIWWLVRKKEKITTVLTGAAVWFLFAILLESIPKMILFNAATPLGQIIMGNTVLFAAVSSLLAGIFEETGRYLAFKTVLRKRTNRETAISYGIGHGGFEAMYVLGLTGVLYLGYAARINAGTFQDMIDLAASTGADTSVLETLPALLLAVTPQVALISAVERIFAMLLHVSLSILVFCAVRKPKGWYYVLAVLLHALFDVPAALYQAGVVNLYVVEGMLGVFSVVLFAVVWGRFRK